MSFRTPAATVLRLLGDPDCNQAGQFGSWRDRELAFLFDGVVGKDNSDAFGTN